MPLPFKSDISYSQALSAAAMDNQAAAVAILEDTANFTATNSAVSINNTTGGTGAQTAAIKIVNGATTEIKVDAVSGNTGRDLELEPQPGAGTGKFSGHLSVLVAPDPTGAAAGVAVERLNVGPDKTHVKNNLEVDGTSLLEGVVTLGGGAPELSAVTGVPLTLSTFATGNQNIVLAPDGTGILSVGGDAPNVQGAAGKDLILSTADSNKNIVLAPNGTGQVILSTAGSDSGAAATAAADGAAGTNLSIVGGAGGIGGGEAKNGGNGASISLTGGAGGTGGTNGDRDGGAGGNVVITGGAGAVNGNNGTDGAGGSIELTPGNGAGTAAGGNVVIPEGALKIGATVVNSTGAELNLLDASGGTATTTTGAANATAAFTSNNSRINDTLTLGANLADDGELVVTVTSDKVLATSIVLASFSKGTVVVSEVAAGSFNATLKNTSGAQVNNGDPVKVNFLIL